MPPALAERTSSAAVRRDRLRVGQERLGTKVARRPGVVLYSVPRPDLAASRGRGTVLSAPSRPPRGPGRGPPAPGATVDRGGLSSVRPNRVAPPGRGPAHVCGRQGSAAMSATHPTRLETRTKESNARASRRVLSKTPWRNESEGQRALAEVGSRPPGAPGAPPARLARSVGEVAHERAR